MQLTAKVTNLNTYRKRTETAQQAIITALDPYDGSLRREELKAVCGLGKNFDAVLDKLLKEDRIEDREQQCYRINSRKLPRDLSPPQLAIIKALRGAESRTWNELEDICGRDLPWTALVELTRLGAVTSRVVTCYQLSFDERFNR